MTFKVGETYFQRNGLKVVYVGPVDNRSIFCSSSGDLISRTSDGKDVLNSMYDILAPKEYIIVVPESECVVENVTAKDVPKEIRSLADDYDLEEKEILVFDMSAAIPFSLTKYSSSEITKVLFNGKGK